MLNGMLARKRGMTQIFESDGTALPVTVLEGGAMTVIQKKDAATHGVEKIQVGFEAISDSKLNRPLKGHFADQGAMRVLREFKTEDFEGIEVGQVFDSAIFSEGEVVSVSGTSKGKGFAGVMKRHNFAGQPAAHGHRGHRGTGSIGQCATPARVFKGKKMPGHYGNAKVTVKGLQIVKIFPEENVVLIKGAVPGKNGGLVTIFKK